MHACDVCGKRFIIPVPSLGEDSINIRIEDRKRHETKAIDDSTEDSVIKMLGQKWGWNHVDRAASGSVVMLMFKPTGITTSEMVDDILSAKNILGLEFTPNEWRLSYIIPRAWNNSISQIKQQHPERFKYSVGTHAGKRSGSRFRRF